MDVRIWALCLGKAVDVHTHWGLGAPQSMQRLFSLTLAISCSLDRVSGSTSHILLILTVVVYVLLPIP